MFASSSTQTILGTSATDVLKKATTVSAIVFLCTSLTLAIFSSKRSKSLLENVKVEAPQSLEIPITTTEVKEEPAVEETQTQDKK